MKNIRAQPSAAKSEHIYYDPNQAKLEAALALWHEKRMRLKDLGAQPAIWLVKCFRILEQGGVPTAEDIEEEEKATCYTSPDPYFGRGDAKYYSSDHDGKIPRKSRN
jgi:hypothetical protein